VFACKIAPQGEKKGETRYLTANHSLSLLSLKSIIRVATLIQVSTVVTHAVLGKRLPFVCNLLLLNDGMQEVAGLSLQ
jgi:hypothetical protein